MEINWVTIVPDFVVTFSGVLLAVFLPVIVYKFVTRHEEIKEAIRLVTATGAKAEAIYTGVCSQLAEIEAGDTGSVEGRGPGMKTYPLPITELRFMIENASYQKRSFEIVAASWLYETAELRHEKMEKAIAGKHPLQGKRTTLILYAQIMETLVKWCYIDYHQMKRKISTDQANEDLSRLISDFEKANRAISKKLTATLTDPDTLKKNYHIPPK